MKHAWSYQTKPNNFTFATKSAKRMKHIHIWKSCVKTGRYQQLDAWFALLIPLISSFVADRLRIWCLQQQVVLFLLHGVALLHVLFARWDTKKSWRWCRCQGRDAAGWLIVEVKNNKHFCFVFKMLLLSLCQQSELHRVLHRTGSDLEVAKKVKSKSK